MSESLRAPWRITFTGADEWCSVKDLVDLALADERVELAFLFSAGRAGHQPRYPTAEWIRDTAQEIDQRGAGDRVALHLCGSEAREAFLTGSLSDFRLGSIWPYRRIQINGRLTFEQGGRLRMLLGPTAGLQVITQYDLNPDLHELIRRPGHQVLFDASGGRGIERQAWPRHLGDWICGYAGGLGPWNIGEQLPRIAAAAAGAERYWIDMESSLRDEQDHFSIERARQALAAVRLNVTVVHFASTDKNLRAEMPMCGYVGTGETITRNPDDCTCTDCLGWIGRGN
jgi:hypothetical protein